MFFSKKSRADEDRENSNHEFQITLDWLGVERDTDGNFTPFSPLQIFANNGGDTPADRRSGFFWREKEPGEPYMLKILFSIAQSNSFQEQHSYWQGPFYEQFKHSERLRPWATELFDDDIQPVFSEVFEIRVGIWEDLFANDWRNGPSRMNGYNFNNLSAHEFQKYAHEMLRADLISMRACQEQGARWGIQLGLDSDGYLPDFGGFDLKHVKKYSETRWVKYYELGKPSWTGTTPQTMEKNKEKMLRKLKKAAK